MNNPPAAGQTYTTSSAAGHTHQITLSQVQLMALAARQTVVVTTTLVASHTHDFTL